MFRISTLACLAALLALLTVTPASADHPRPDQVASVLRLAHQLQEDAEYLYDVAREERHHFTRSERRVVSYLEELEDQASHFHRRLERYRNDPSHTERDYLRLRRAYRVAVNMFHVLHSTREVRRAMLRMEETMDGLVFYYEEDRYERGQDERIRDDRGRDDRSRRERERPRARGWVSIREIAHDLDRAAEHVYRQARSETRFGPFVFLSGNQRRAVDRLDGFKDAAEHFHKQIERRHDSPTHTLDDFEKVAERYERAARRMHHLSSHIQQEFYRAGLLIEELAHLYHVSGPDLHDQRHIF